MPELAHELRALCHGLGFQHVRYTDGEGAPGIAAYDLMLAEGRHADMHWMEHGRDARASPQLVFARTRSVVVLGMEYGGVRPPDPGGLTGRVAAYAWGRDYHNLIGKRIRKVERWLRDQGFGCFGGVDSRPWIERAWAERSGLGFAAKNCCTIRPGRGSTFFLAVIATSAALPPDPPLMAGRERFCGSCTRCHDLCPTAAFVGDGMLDARRCISYLTIENDGPVPIELRPHLGRWVFGCDDCQDVCPHNHAKMGTDEDDLGPVNAWLDLRWLLLAEDEAVERQFEGSPLRRPGAVGLKRNAAVVLGNLGDEMAGPCLEHALAHANPIVREHAAWALRRIAAASHARHDHAGPRWRAPLAATDR